MTTLQILQVLISRPWSWPLRIAVALLLLTSFVGGVVVSVLIAG